MAPCCSPPLTKTMSSLSGSGSPSPDGGCARTPVERPLEHGPSFCVEAAAAQSHPPLQRFRRPRAPRLAPAPCRLWLGAPRTLRDGEPWPGAEVLPAGPLLPDRQRRLTTHVWLSASDLAKPTTQNSRSSPCASAPRRPQTVSDRQIAHRPERQKLRDRDGPYRQIFFTLQDGSRHDPGVAAA